MRPSHISTVFLGSFIVSIFLLQWNQDVTYPIAYWVSLGAIGFIGCVILLKNKWMGTLLIAASLGISMALLAVMRTTHMPTETTVDLYADGSTVTIEGIVSDEPDRRPLQTKYTVSVTSLTTESSVTLPVTGRVLVSDGRNWPRYQYGDVLRVTGNLQEPGTREAFHYDRYLSRYDIYSIIPWASIKKIDEDKGNPFFAFLYAAKERFEAQINRLLPEPHASLLAGLLTGSRRGIPDHLLESFHQTGLTHLIAISGFNITIVLVIIMGLLFWLPLRYRLLPAGIAIVIFTLFVGASASVVRAAIMGILGLLALQTGRLKSALLAILWTVVIMLLWNPKYLWYDAGFQLSFLAVLGLTFLSPLLQKPARFLPEFLGIREAFLMTVSAQIVAVPWIAYLFGRFSLIAPVANVLVSPLVPLAMLMGFVATLVSILFFPFGLFFAYGTWGLLELIIRIAEFFAAIPRTSINNVSLTLKFIVVYYIVLTLTLALALHRTKKLHH